MTPKLATLYLGVLLSLAFVLSSFAHADGSGRKRKPVRYYATPHEDRDRDRHCEDKVQGLGTQWIGTEGAMDAARKDWMEKVRYTFGESFIDMKNAESFVARCGRVSIGEVAGQVTYRCEIWARPCKAQFSKVEGQK